MFIVLLLLLLVCVVAPWLGADRGDDRTEAARPDAGWFPPLLTR